jgi:hypothetical protein
VQPGIKRDVLYEEVIVACDEDDGADDAAVTGHDPLLAARDVCGVVIVHRRRPYADALDVAGEGRLDQRGDRWYIGRRRRPDRHDWLLTIGRHSGAEQPGPRGGAPPCCAVDRVPAATGLGWKTSRRDVRDDPAVSFERFCRLSQRSLRGTSPSKHGSGRTLNLHRA